MIEKYNPFLKSILIKEKYLESTKTENLCFMTLQR